MEENLLGLPVGHVFLFSAEPRGLAFRFRVLGWGLGFWVLAPHTLTNYSTCQPTLPVNPASDMAVHHKVLLLAASDGEM